MIRLSDGFKALGGNIIKRALTPKREKSGRGGRNGNEDCSQSVGFSAPEDWQATRAYADDDMSDDDAPLAEFTHSTLANAPTPCSGRKRTLSSAVAPSLPVAAPSPPISAEEPPAAPVPLVTQVTECRTKIKELHEWKEQRLRDEDYLGAHRVKELIKEQEEKLRSLQMQLDASGPSRKAQRSTETALRSQLGKIRSDVVPNEGSSGNRLSNPSKESSVTCADSGNDGVQVPGEVGMGDKEIDERGESAADDTDDESDDAETGPWRCIGSGTGLVELRGETAAAASNFPFQLTRDTFDRLYPYQRVSVAWMARLWRNYQGGILADEMGLGKTVQVCASC